MLNVLTSGVVCSRFTISTIPFTISRCSAATSRCSRRSLGHSDMRSPIGSNDGSSWQAKDYTNDNMPWWRTAETRMRTYFLAGFLYRSFGRRTWNWMNAISYLLPLIGVFCSLIVFYLLFFLSRGEQRYSNRLLALLILGLGGYKVLQLWPHAGSFRAPLGKNRLGEWLYFGLIPFSSLYIKECPAFSDLFL